MRKQNKTSWFSATISFWAPSTLSSWLDQPLTVLAAICTGVHIFKRSCECDRQKINCLTTRHFIRGGTLDLPSLVFQASPAQLQCLHSGVGESGNETKILTLIKAQSTVYEWQSF